jgi:putative MATE family efflux protein
VKLFKGKEELDLLEGGIGWPLFYLSLPIVVTNLLQTAYNLADTFWLGQFSTASLAAISFAFPMVFLLFSLGIGVSVAGSILVAQNTGAGDERQAEFAASQTVTFSMVVSAVLGLFGFFAVGWLLGFLGAGPEIHPLAVAYMRIIALGLPFMFGFFVFISLMRGYGDTVTPMVVMFWTVVLNVILDPLLIFGWTAPVTLAGATLAPPVAIPRMGIEGAAVATVVSRGLAMVVGLGIMFRGVRGVRIRPGDMVPDPGYFRKIVDLGLPASVEGSGRALSVNAILLVVSMFSTPVVAAFGIGIRVFSTIFLPAIAVGQGVETMTGQNIGASNYDRAGRIPYVAGRVMFVILAAVGLVIFVFPDAIVRVFTDDPAVIDAGGLFLRVSALTFGFTGLQRAFTGAFRGAGKTLVAAAIAISMLAVIRLPLAYVGATTVGVLGMWLAFPVSNVSGTVIAWAWFRRGTWRGADARREADAPDGETDAESDPAETEPPDSDPTTTDD